MNKEKFLKVYSNLPLNLRDEVILVLPDRGRITWNVAYVEVDADTKVGQKILNRLAQFEII